MAAKDHGQSLFALRLQPGGLFKRTLSGFDTGQRTYLCDSSLVAANLPEPGMPDSSLPGGAFPSMFVDESDVDYGRNGIAKISVSLLGLLRGDAKGPQISGDTSTEEFREGDYLIYNALPVVSVVYVQSQQPDVFDVGGEAAPPILISAGEPIRLPYYKGPLQFVEPLWKGWIRRSRNFRKTGTLFEVTDGHEYRVVRQGV